MLCRISALQLEERRGRHDPVFLTQQIAGFRAHLEKRLPLGVGLHGRAALLAVRGVLVRPDVHIGVELAGLGHAVKHRLAEMALLGRPAVPVVQLELPAYGAGFHGVGAMVEDHDPPPWWTIACRAAPRARDKPAAGSVSQLTPD